MNSIWTGVRERVLALREAPYWQEVFGAKFLDSGHRFELMPVLDEAQVAQGERELGVRLPEEYRTFLLEVGAGGAGPDYGLFPFARPGTDRVPDAAEADAEGAADAEGSLPAAALPFRPERTQELNAHYELEPRAADYGASQEEQDRFWREYAQWDQRWDELEDNLTDGTLCISEQGCAYYTVLALTGDERGTMWDDVRAVGEGVLPVRTWGESEARVTYADWYLKWLANAERQAWEKPRDPRGPRDLSR
ncbi:SMI1/KNR4 family protein [Streptomyces cavernicola]|uniref:SMI1/KNR4 family protein n=1 Tax=Streptomyces cavernicola TaxID=3043613 RepID=A0ABT6SDW1_9ACTN|nr:SMI1/KNR4 family protein [Streptomyces sp. B-S-A6]MDI3406154.1 SMI1/KNR4 family protein [Streptomyces sp. B-S-A6]